MHRKSDLTFPILTFPGVIIHEISHLFFCQLSGLKIFKVVFFQLKNPLGYVEHSQPRSFIQTFLITIGPLIIGSSISVVLYVFAITIANSIISNGLNAERVIMMFIFIWLGFSIGIHCLPSDGDGRTLLSETNRHLFQRYNPFAIILYPFILVIMTANYLKRLYFDYIYVIFLFIVSFWVFLKI